MVRKAMAADGLSLARLAIRLWPHHTLEDMAEEFDGYLRDPQCALFLACQEAQPIGFAQCQLRHDYVEGTDSSPVGYLEGIYVLPGYRGQGYARAMLSACEDWAKEMGCTEFASDCELTNSESLSFHLKVGFAEVGRMICFAKKL